MAHFADPRTATLKVGGREFRPVQYDESVGTIWGEIPIDQLAPCLAGISDGLCAVHDCPQADAEIRRLRAENEELRRHLKAALDVQERQAGTNIFDLLRERSWGLMVYGSMPRPWVVMTFGCAGRISPLWESRAVDPLTAARNAERLLAASA
jgi:hypothetical protein